MSTLLRTPGDDFGITHNSPHSSAKTRCTYISSNKTTSAFEGEALDTIFGHDFGAEDASPVDPQANRNRPTTWVVTRQRSNTVFFPRGKNHASTCRDAADSKVISALDIDVLVTATHAATVNLKWLARATQELATLQPAPATGTVFGTTSELEIAAMEARQQRDAILLSRDLRSAIQSLMSDEGVSSYDLGVATGVSRANLSIWRSRPVDKLRSDNNVRLSKLLFVWKLWLRVSNGEMLGHWLRDPLPSSTSLLDVLCDETASENDLEGFVIALAKHAKQVEAMRLARRRDLAGLTALGSGSATIE